MVREKTPESPLNCREIKPVNPKENQPWIFTGRTDAEAEAPILVHLIWWAKSLEKTLMLGKIEGRRRKGQQGVRWLDGITTSMDVSFSELPEVVNDREGWCAAVHGVVKFWTQVSNWTTITSGVLMPPELIPGSGQKSVGGLAAAQLLGHVYWGISNEFKSCYFSSYSRSMLMQTHWIPMMFLSWNCDKIMATSG